MKLIGGRSRANKRKDFFTQRRVNLWNSLPQDVVMATHLDGFKRGLEEFLEGKAISMALCYLQYYQAYVPQLLGNMGGRVLLHHVLP